MNLKKSFMGAVAGLALVGSIAAPIAQVSAGESGDQATAVVTLTEGGLFDFDIQGNEINFPATTFDAYTAAHGTNLNGAMDYLYTDTKSYRGNFTTTLKADDFVSADANGYTISATNLKVTYLTAPVQGQCCNFSGLGGIGGISTIADPSTGATSQSDATWNPPVAINNATPINKGFAGIGTLWTSGSVWFNLAVPAHTHAATYTSTITATVTFTQP